MTRSEIIRRVMLSVTVELLNELNTREGNIFFDKIPRSRPYFEWDINCGRCEDWAVEVDKRLGEFGIICCMLDNNNFIRYQDLPNHIFIKIGRKYYDCECIEGVTRILNLPIYGRNEKLEREEARAFYQKTA